MWIQREEELPEALGVHMGKKHFWREQHSSWIHRRDLPSTQRPSAAGRKDVPCEGPTSLKSEAAAGLTCEGCWLPGGRQWKRHRGVHWNPHGHKQNTLQVLGAQNRNSRGSHKIKSLANSITLRGLSNYRASTTAYTCNLTDLVRVAQQWALQGQIHWSHAWLCLDF